MKIKGEIQTFNKSILLKSFNHDVENKLITTTQDLMSQWLTLKYCHLFLGSEEETGSYSSQFLQRFTNILYVKHCLKKVSRAFREWMKQKGFEENKATMFTSKIILKWQKYRRKNT